MNERYRGKKTGFQQLCCWARYFVHISSREMAIAMEIGLMVLAILVTIIGLYLYVRLSPVLEIPSEYFFKVREPKIRARRLAEAKAKAAQVAAKDLLDDI